MLFYAYLSTGTPSSQRDLYKYYLVREFNGEKNLKIKSS